jgi:cytoplasmic iron level regulating protein YaaA (DUF328/UPF0246 family)
MKRKLLIISCSGRKHKFESPQAAFDVYDGVTYRVIKYLKRSKSLENIDILILSAEYGLIESITPIKYYDRRMTRQRALQLSSQAESTFRKHLANKQYQEIYIDLGQDYLGALNTSVFEATTAKVILATGKIGQRLQQLKTWLSAG